MATIRRPALLVALACLGCRAPADGDDDPAAPDAAETDGGIGCAATDPRSPATEVFVAPVGLEQRLVDFIDGAETSLDVQMYLFTVDAIADRVVAAHQRGVAVRVLLDPDHEGNPDVRGRLTGAGVPTRDAPARFEFAHAKYLIADGDRALIMSANLNYGALADERNYGAVVRDPDDVADLAAIFEADWTGGADPDLACTRLVVSPLNSRSRILALIGAAEQRLDLAVIYLSDSTIRSAVIQAHQRGAEVRVLLADTEAFPDNAATATTFENQGIEVRIATTGDFLHAKLIVADGVALVGSQNLSPTSLGENREVGLLVTEAAPVATIEAQLDADWAAGSPF